MRQTRLALAGDAERVGDWQILPIGEPAKYIAANTARCNG